MLLVLVLFGAFLAEAPPSSEAVQLWFTYYYLKPRPELALPSLGVIERELQQEKGRSLADEVTRGGLRTFYAHVFAQNDALVREVERRLPTLSVGQQAFVREALRRCPSAACALVVPAGPVALRRSPQPDPGTLDDAWAAFFATGDARYVDAVIGVLPWLEVRGDPQRLLTGGAARWSLASNAYQHARVLAICEESAASASGPTKRVLDEIISQAKAERAKNPPPEPR